MVISAAARAAAKILVKAKTKNVTKRQYVKLRPKLPPKLRPKLRPKPSIMPSYPGFGESTTKRVGLKMQVRKPKITGVVKKKSFVKVTKSQTAKINAASDGYNTMGFISPKLKTGVLTRTRTTKPTKRTIIHRKTKLKEYQKWFDMSFTPKKKRKMTLKEIRRARRNRPWYESHPTHSRTFLGFGGIFGSLASYTFWNRDKKGGKR